MERRAVIGNGAPSFTQSKSPQSPGVKQGHAIEQTRKLTLWKQTPVRGKSCGWGGLWTMLQKCVWPVTLSLGSSGNAGRAPRRNYFLSNVFCRQYFSSGLISVISMPALTMNLQLSKSWGRSSSGNLPTTRQYWQS
jgi:hypothetical protein